KPPKPPTVTIPIVIIPGGPTMSIIVRPDPNGGYDPVPGVEVTIPIGTDGPVKTKVGAKIKDADLGVDVKFGFKF
ncbi:MAG: hypothetical protein SFU56_04095, partial [Capsulimonadales bacterium]|nr:hypothetical protein [Capsulimonadales bacterium]